MSYELRVTGPDEWRAAADTMAAALHFAPSTDEKWPSSVASWQGSHSISAWDGDRCVGHGAYYFFDTAVPGGERLATAGVTRVGVRQTHTRQGILTAIMSRMLHDAHEQGMPLASLRASEAVIYSRFGYGVAGEAIDYTITRPRLRPEVGTTGSFEIIDRDQAMEVIPALYDRIAFTRPGVIRRPEWMWRRYMEEFLEGSKPRQVIVHRDGRGGTDGFVDVETAWDDDDRFAIATIHDLWGANPEAEAALWRYVFDIDLVRTIKAEERPVDDLIRWFLIDRRDLQVKSVWDEQWVRLIDVDTALRARTYGSDEAVTIAVRDRMLQHNNATWRVAGGKVEPAGPSAPADLTVDIAALGAAYFGATSWFELAATPSVEVVDRAAIARADRIFQSRPLPRCGSFF
jgi:predicted acetyltransferase